jgi:hypothetical protein
MVLLLSNLEPREALPVQGPHEDFFGKPQQEDLTCPKYDCSSQGLPSTGPLLLSEVSIETLCNVHV